MQNQWFIIKKYHSLNVENLAAAQSLVKTCEERDLASPCIQWTHDLNAHQSMESWFLAYEGVVLVGVLSLFSPMREEIEFTGCVHPEKRQQGVWNALLLAATSVMQEYPIKSCLYVCDRSSIVGGSYIRAKLLALRNTEYAMKLDKSSAFPKITPLTMRRATLVDIDAMAAIGADAFEETLEDSKHFLEAAFHSEHRIPYCGLIEEEIVSICALTYEDDSIGINGLGVHKSQQGKGYGKATIVTLLKQIIDDKRDILLDVDSSNVVAHPLYLSLGFKEVQVVDYFLIDL